MKKILAIVLSLFLSATTFARIRPPKGFNGKAFDATMALSVTNKNETENICTAIRYEKIPGGYHLITAGHCIQDQPATAKFSVSEDLGGPMMSVKVLKVRQEGNIDFAELELDTYINYSVIPLGTDEDFRVGDEIINPNFAEMVAKQLSLGRISTQPIIPSEDGAPAEADGYYLVQVFGSNGSSGSAVISKKTHKIVGICVFGFNSVIGMGIEPISLYQKFLSKPSQAHPAPKKSLEQELIQIIIGQEFIEVIWPQVDQ